MRRSTCNEAERIPLRSTGAATNSTRIGARLNSNAGRLENLPCRGYTVQTVQVALTSTSTSRSGISVMAEFFPEVPVIPFEGPQSKNPLAFKYYNADDMVE